MEGHLCVAAPNGQRQSPWYVLHIPAVFSALRRLSAFIPILPRQIFFGKKRLYLMYKNFSYRKPAVKDVSLALPLGAAAWHPPRGTICKPTLPAAVHQPPSWFWHFHLGAEHAGVVVPVKNIHLLPCACRDICLFGDEINLWPKHREIPSPAPPQQYSLWIFMIFDWFGASISPR